MSKMPISVNSRRRERRVPSPDDIEEDTPTQNRIRREDSMIINQTDDFGGNGEDMDDEDEQQPRRPGHSKNARREKVVENGGDAADLEGDDPLIDFRDAPLDRNHLEKLKGLASDWTMTRTHIHIPAFSALNDVAISIAEFEDDERGGEVCVAHWALVSE